MNPESITVSLDMAKKLKDAGWPQDACHWFYEGFMLDDNDVPRDWQLFVGRNKTADEFCVAAPTAEEILQRLPSYVIERGITYGLRIEKLSPLQTFDLTGENLPEKWKLDYYRIRDGIELAPAYVPVAGDTLANAAAAMYCYLAEQHLLISGNGTDRP